MKFSFSRFRKSREAFTLTELMVVMAIILLLAGTLLSSVGSIREKANRTLCNSNLRQLGLAMQGYVNDYAKYPSSSEQTEGDLWFLDALPSYIGYTVYQTNAGVWRCPTDRGKYRSGIVQQTYGMNPNLSRIRPAVVLHPSQTCLLSDGTIAPGVSFPYWYWELRGYETNDLIHQGGVNVLFADLHTEWLPGKSIPTLTDTNSSFWTPR